MIYLEIFQPYLEDRHVYPYRIVYPMQIESIEFAPITIFYGSNGSGKSTLLNIIAYKVGVSNKTLGNTSEYFDGFVRKCTDVSMGIPTDSMFIRSEDIMELIASRRKKNASIDRKVMGWFAKGADKSTKGTLEEEMYAKKQFEDIYENGAATMNNSFYDVVKRKLFEKNDEESNGETAIDYFKERLFSDNLYFLDEPENSMSPILQQELADYISLLAYRLNSQFIIATHSPFMLSIQGACIYDLDSHPSVVRKWWQLENMKVYYKLFERFSKRFNVSTR
jgi:predicted ATPase